MAELSPEQAVTGLERTWNESDEEGYLALFAPDVVFISSENWPETGPVENRDAVRSFWHEFRAVWDDVRLDVREIWTGDGVAAARCAWVTRGRASGIESALEFGIVLWVEGQTVARGQFFEDPSDAARAAGLP